MALAALTPAPGHANAVEADLQAKILLRALAYDRNLKERVGDSVTVAVVSHKGDGSAARSDILRAFGSLAKLTFQGLPLHVVEHEFFSIDHLKEDLAARGIDVLYLCGGLEAHLTSIVNLTHSKKVATITAEDAYVAAGVAIGVMLRDRSPKLWVNLASSKEEGLNLSADLMRVAEVIR
ncbi:MAG TPA: YfiR family protein [Myxococcota bacterium]|nr:YfiR family protein [Myxococcota bacterium]